MLVNTPYAIDQNDIPPALARGCFGERVQDHCGVNVSTAFFSDTYAHARQRFIGAARAIGAEVHAHPVCSTSSGNLAVDVAMLGTDTAPAMVVSSGLHGVEGFLGSAVQLALLEKLHAHPLRSEMRWVLIHALNPYGFAQLRRVNEDNVDLNRNFLADDSSYAGAPPLYAELDALVNPRSSPRRVEPFRLKALGYIRRFGLQTLKDTIAGGQYDYPQGLFYGGNAPCASTRIVQAHSDGWLAGSPRCLHIDLHTGLGRFAQPTILLNEPMQSQRFAWHARTFGVANVESLAQTGGTAYRVSGLFGSWLQRRFNTRDYRFAGVEIGTYGPIRVLAALRAENRAHHYCAPGDPAIARTKSELRECFCPRSTTWRDTAVGKALQIIEQGAQALRSAAA